MAKESILGKLRKKTKAEEVTPAAPTVTENAPAMPAAKAPEPAEPVPAQETEKKKKTRTKPQDFSKLTRNKVVQIRMTEDEIAQLKAAAADANMSMADFIMAGIHQERKVILPGGGNIWEQLQYLGRNLNQAQAQCNKAMKYDMAPDIDSVIRAANKVEEAIDQLLELKQTWDVKLSQEVKPNADSEMCCQ